MYQKTEWKTGDVVTAEKLNKIENGISTIPILEFTPEIVNNETKFIGHFSLDDLDTILNNETDIAKPVIIKLTIPGSPPTPTLFFGVVVKSTTPVSNYLVTGVSPSYSGGNAIYNLTRADDWDFWSLTLQTSTETPIPIVAN